MPLTPLKGKQIEEKKMKKMKNLYSAIAAFDEMKTENDQ